MFELEGVTIAHDGRVVLDVEQLSLRTDAFTVILGHNGSGKSTLMGALARQHRPTQGRILLNGQPLDDYSSRAFAKMVAFLPQRLPDVPGLSVRELCGLGRFPWLGALGRWRPEDDRIVDTALERTGLTRFADHPADRLSGGERQRAWIAMLLAQQAPVLMLDEPISALDLAHQLEVLRLLRSLRDTAGCGVIVILHEVNLAARFADRIVALKHGRVCFDGTPAALMRPEVLSGLYGVGIQMVEHPSRATPVAVIA